MTTPPGAQFLAVAMTDRGRVRGNNEDKPLQRRVFAQDRRAYRLMAVADGMGGGVRGEVASQLAIEALEESLLSFAWDDPGTALHGAALLANDRVYDRGTGKGEAPVSAMGTTLVAALVDEESRKTWVVNIGDSRAYVVHPDGRMTQVTQDHSVVAERVRAGDLTSAEARHAEGRNVITRAIGTDPDVEPEGFQSHIEDGDRLLLCSDGLHGMLTDRRIGRITAGNPLGAVPQLLVDAANRAGGKDNVTVVVGGLARPDEAAALEAEDAPTIVDLQPLRMRRRVPTLRLRKPPVMLVAVGALVVAGGMAIAALLMRTSDGGGAPLVKLGAAGSTPTTGMTSSQQTPPDPTATAKPSGAALPAPTRVQPKDQCIRALSLAEVAELQLFLGLANFCGEYLNPPDGLLSDADRARFRALFCNKLIEINSQAKDGGPGVATATQPCDTITADLKMPTDAEYRSFRDIIHPSIGNVAATATPLPPTPTPLPPTATAMPPTPVPTPTATPVLPPTASPVLPTPTKLAPTPTVLGRPDFDQYCKNIGREKATYAEGSGTWSCSEGRGTSQSPFPMDPNLACRWQYSNSDAFARPIGAQSLASSWRCYRP